MNIKSEDCVAEILKKYPDSKRTSWKRRKKSTIGDAVCRLFEHVNSGVYVAVIERGGKFTLGECDDAGKLLTQSTSTPTTSAKITEKELAQKIVDARANHKYVISGDYEPLEKEFVGAIDTILCEDNMSSWSEVLEDLTPKVRSDFSSPIDFSTENMEWTLPESYSGSLCGFRTLSNGLSILGMSGGGDWETPLYFIIYFDGTELRGYVPTDGNPYNTATNEAYGNADNEQDDENNSQQRFGISFRDVNINQTLIDADIVKNIP